MGNSYKYAIFTVLSLIFCAGLGYAGSKYVTDITKITMRSAPDTEQKIIAMLKSGTKLDIIEESGAWSKIRTKKGKEGWALTSLLVKKKPAVVLLDSFKKENKELSDQVTGLKIENGKLIEVNQRLAGIEKKYIALEKESKTFLELKKKYQIIKEKYDVQKEMIASFEDSHKNKIMIWLLIGIGVFIFGVLLGIGSKKNRRTYLR